MKRRVFFAVVCGLFALAVNPLAHAIKVKSPEDLVGEVDKVHARIIGELTKLKEEKNLNRKTALALIQSEISDFFDFPRITKRVVGKNWKRASIEDQEKIIELFSTMLEKSYARLLARFSGQTVEVLGIEMPKDGRAVMEMQVNTEKKTILFEYLFSLNVKEEQWRIDGIRVEGISMMKNYRRQFESVVSRKGISGLIETLTRLSKK